MVEVGILFADLGKNIGPLACTATHILSKDVEFPGMLQFWMNGLQRTHGLGQGRGYPVPLNVLTVDGLVVVCSRGGGDGLRV